MSNMLILVLFIITALIAAGFVFADRKTSEPVVSPPSPRPRPSFSSKPMRRRCNSGGFYPAGYSGSYEEGEDLVDFIVWMAILDAMSEEELVSLGEYAGADEWRESEAIEEPIPETEPVEEPMPEAETFEVISDEPERETRGGWGGSDDSDSGGWDSSDDSDSGGWDD